MNLVAKRSFELSAQKRALLELLVKEAGIESSNSSKLARRTQVDELPLSFSEQRLWFIDQLQPNSSVYNLPTAIKLRGKIDVAALEQSFNEIIDRHEILRTTFTAVDGKPFQAIAPALQIPLPVVDLQTVSPEMRDSVAQKFVEEEAHRPFDLAKDPLLRTTLLRLSEEEHVLMVTMHHIISDGWSLYVVYQELQELYKAFLRGERSPLLELPIQYADFAIWQRQWLSGDILESQLSYWKQQLAGASTVLELPIARQRPAVPTNRGKTRALIISKPLSEALNSLARAEGSTSYMMLLAAFNVLLYRYSGSEDILIGSPIANRNQRELEPLIGFFVNTIVLRGNLTGNPSFRQLLSRVRQTTLGAYAHQDVPFEKLVEVLQPNRDLSVSPLFQVMFVLQNAPTSDLQLPGVTLEALSVDVKTAMFDLTLELEETADGFKGFIEYSTDLFDAVTIERMAGHFQTLLEAIVANPEQRIAQLPILSETERHQLLVEWNDNRVDYPDRRVHQLFEEQVEREPDAVAVVFKDEQLTYRELNQKANQIAHYLRSLNINPDVMVGISVERSLWVVAGILGILKAGAAYVPIDPAYPKDRIEHILADSKISVLLTQKSLANSLSDRVDKLICLDSEWEAIARHRSENPRNQTNPNNLAYVIYTSGSTGKPKGVAIEHGSLVNAYRAWEDAYMLRSAVTTHLQMASFSFDVFSGDLVRALCSGAKLVLCPTEFLLEPEQLYTLMRAQKVDCAEFVPAVLRNLIQYLETTNQSLDFMNLIAAGSDSWYLSEYYKVKEFCGSKTRLINSYGVTETTIDSTYFETTVEAIASDERSSPSSGSDRLIPIGRSFANTQIYILDANLQPVPIGIPGELYIGGANLARGYLNQPDLTAQKFVPNPFGKGEGKREKGEFLSANGRQNLDEENFVSNWGQNSEGRLYKTNDLARYLPDGNIEFLGRIDNQVKIRGFRIELGEIESVLSEHPDVLQGAVVVREDKPGDKRLIAYIVAKRERESLSDRASKLPGEVRSFVKQKLPHYMVPSAFVILEAMPLTPNGKIDRRNLPVPVLENGERSQAFIPPSTPIEEIVAHSWREILNLDVIGIDENFFELGGHSLLATQVISRLRRQLSVEISLRVLFEKPTVAELADYLETALRAEIHASAPPLLPIVRESSANEPISQRLPLSFAQFRLWFLDQLEPNNPAYNIPTAVRLSGALDVATLERSINEIVRRHETLRTIFGSTDGNPYQVIVPTCAIALPITDLTSLPKQERESAAQRFVAEESQQPFNLSQWPLIRNCLLRLDAEEHVLLVTIHHIVSDGWSVNIFFKELGLVYNAFSLDRPSPLPELSIQYADFASWQRQWLEGKGLEQQLAYWKPLLGDTLPVLELPLDRPRPPIQTFTPGTQSLMLPEALTHALKALSKQSGATLFMTLLAAFKTLLGRYSGQDDIIVGSPIAGRNRSETEDLIGFFINTVVLRTHLDGNPSFQELLSRVRTVALDAYAHEDMPFEKLVEELQPERDLSRTPLFQVWVNMLNLTEEPIKLAGLQVENFDVSDPAAKFDLSLYIEERNLEIELRLVYNAELFGESRTKEMLAQFQHLLAQIAENPQQKIADYSLVTPQSQSLLPNPTQPIIPEWHGTVHAQFSEQAQRVPQRLAIADNLVAWSYAELDMASNQLANYYLENGIASGDVVAIYAHRSASLVVAVLGILKAGAALMILDSTYPASRLVDCLQLAQPKGLLQLEAAGTLPADVEEFVATLENCCWLKLPHQIAEIRQRLQGYSSEVTGVEVNPDDLAYIAFTSGSTGKPKGILGTHRPLSHFLNWHVQTFGFNESERFSLLSGLAHDPLLRDMFTPLWLGATLCIPDPESIATPGWLFEWMKQQQISVTHLTPAMAQLVSETPERSEILSWRYAFFGGEQLRKSDVTKLRSIAPNLTCVNFYGATETPQAMSYFFIPPTAEASELPATLPVGRGINDVQLLICNSSQKLAGIGEFGEIYIRTPYLAQGYLGDRTLTSERFVMNWHTRETSDRLYKTGDLGRYLPDGNIAIVGRGDRQVKIRGFRIEPGEIEAALNSQPKVQISAVMAREDVPGNIRLVAYVVPHQADGSLLEAQSASFSAELRRLVKEKLPDYMVPSYFVILEALPLTPNGKLDRRALPAPDGDGGDRTDTFVAPRNPIEEIIADIWSEVLQIPSIGVRDNFFELGGHSLLATQVIARLRRQLGRDISMRTLFEQPTVAQLAERFHNVLSTESELREPPLLRVVREASPEENRSQQIPLSFAQLRLWFLDQLEPNSPAYNLCLAVRLLGALNVSALERSLNEIVRRHEGLRATFNSADGQPFQIIAPSLTLTLPVADLSSWPARDRLALAQQQATEEALKPFNLNQGPLIRIQLLHLDAEEHVLLVTIHHIVSDGWSINVFFKELGQFYSAFCNNLPSPLAELPIQYADFALWQQQWLQGEVLEQKLAYWKQHLGGPLPVLELPTDRPRPAIQTFTAASRTLRLTQTLSQALKALSRQEGATLFMTLLAAFKTLLSRYSGQDDIIVGSPIAGRNRAETEDLIGFFVNTVVLRTHLDGKPSFQELLRRVRSVALEAYAREDMPFEKLVEELHPERNLSRTPLFQVWFNMLNLGTKRIELSGLHVEPLAVPETASKFDLTMYVEERDETIELILVYNADLFDESRMAEMLAQYQHLLGQVVQNPTEKIADFSLVTPQSQSELPNPTQPIIPEWYGAVHDRFAEQAQRVPQRQAIADNLVAWNYGELDAASNQLANYCLKNGIGSGDVVAIYAHRSPSVVVAVLGILKAGAAFMILDSTYPASRLVDCLQLAQPKGLLQLEAAGTLPVEIEEYIAHLNGSRLKLPQQIAELRQRLQGYSTEATGIEVKPDDLAYIAFTSGSTGKPKGIVGTHRPLSHFLNWHVQTFGFNESERFSLLSGLAHDPLLRDMFTPLWLGATLCIPDPESIATPGWLFDWIKQQQISVTHLTPAMAQLVSETTARSEILSWRYAFFGGDKLRKSDVEQMRSLASNLTVVNFYGATETPQAMGYFVVPNAAEGSELPATLPVGRGIDDVQLLICNRSQKLSGIGELGEIYIRTPYLAQGYLGDETLTSERFVANLHSRETSDRLYKTGDLGRYLPDGNIAIVGRGDRQVKIRGFRIEPGEIEAVLTQHSAVRQSTVIDWEDVSGEKRLVAYLVSDLVLERVLLQTRCRLEWSDTPEDIQGLRQRAVDLTTIDISPDGIGLLNVPATWETGQLVRCGLQLPAAMLSAGRSAYEEERQKANLEIQSDDELTWFEGTVAWLEGEQRAGIAFQTTPAQHHLLRKTVKYVANTQGIQVSDLRRADPRVPLQSPCLVELSNGIRLKLTTENLSAGGVRLTGKTALWKQGENVRLWLQLPDEKRPIALQGTISWHWKNSVGIKFVKGEDAPTERTLISQLLQNIHRADPRLPLRNSASVEFDDGASLPVATENISRGGIRLVADADIWKDNQRLRLKVQLPGLKDELWLTGKVLWHRDRRAGIQFDIASTEQTLLDRSVEYIIATQELSITHLRSFLKGKLPAYAMPSTFVMLDELPLTPNGKVDRRALPSPDFDRLDLDTSFAAPSDILECQLAEIWQKVLGIKSIGIKDNFFDLGGHSLLAVRLFSHIQNTFGKNLPLATLFQAPTIEQLAGILRSQGWVAPWRNLVTIQTGGHKSPLFCVHAVGGNVLSYKAVAHYMGKDRPVYGLQSRGLDGIQPPHTRLEEMASDYIQEMRTVQPNGPYFLAGHSFGGTLAFEIAQQLTRAGQKVALLALLDSFCPNILTDETPPFRYQLSIHKLNLSRLQWKDKLVYIVDRVWWKIEALLKKITNKLFSRSGQSNAEQIPEHLERIQEANYLATRNYIPQVYPGRVTLLRAIERPTSAYYKPLMGWGELAAEGVEVVEVPGHHKTLILEPRVRVLAKKLKNCLEKAEAEV